MRSFAPVTERQIFSDLVHEGYLVIEELLFNNLSVLLVGDGTELDIEFLPGGWYHAPIRSGHGA